MAESFTGHLTLQAVIDLAVTEFLQRLHRVEGFTEALANAEREKQRRAGVRNVRRRGN